ncbi:hypothetical protein BDR07DRAFT_1403290, partial [Suillus spraguei]
MKAQGTHTKGPQRKVTLLLLQFHLLNQPLPPSCKPPNIKEFSGPLQRRRHDGNKQAYVDTCWQIRAWLRMSH